VAVIVLDVHRHRQAELVQVRLAGGLPPLLARPREDREQDRRQDRDDGDNHEQLN